MLTLPERFEKSLRESNLIKPGARVAAACSGGPDSVALLCLLKDLRRKWRLKLSVLHFNHGLRAAAAADARFVAKLARRAGIPFISEKGTVRTRTANGNKSPEEAAREARYEFFDKAAQKHKLTQIAVAHTRDDQAETTLMRILQGTGLRGLSGIRRVIKRGKIQFIRPLLDFSKQDLLEYLKANKLAFRNDRSNLSSKFVRNRIRHELMPLLARRFNPRVVEALARLPEIAAAENELILDLEQKAWKQVLAKSKAGELALRRGRFAKQPAPLQFRLLNRALQQIDPASGLNYEAWKRLAPALLRPRYRASLQRNIEISLKPGRIMLVKQKARPSKKAFAVSGSR